MYFLPTGDQTGEHISVRADDQMKNVDDDEGDEENMILLSSFSSRFLHFWLIRCFYTEKSSFYFLPEKVSDARLRRNTDL